MNSKTNHPFRHQILNENCSDAFEDDSTIARYYPGILKACKKLTQTSALQEKPGFEPELELPELTELIRRFLEPAKVEIQELESYKSRKLAFLNLMKYTETQTTKAYPSLAMVMRAVAHIQKTGENIMILVATSGNKGIALRAAVERAIKLGLVTPQQLRVMMIVGTKSVLKLRQSDLFTEPELRKLNPVVLYDGKEPAFVKQIGKNFYDQYADDILQKSNTRIWYSLNLDNYQTIDTTRAFFEHEYNESHLHQDASKVIHAHAVSSAFGLIGHRLGRSILEDFNICPKEEAPGYFLVQHLETPDMVLHYCFDSFSKEHMPTYKLDQDGLFKQNTDIRFPAVTKDVNENLDPTFYTKQPVTSPQVTKMIRELGGGGIVVSLYECQQRYRQIRELLKPTQVALPESLDSIQEWSLIMVFTGVLNAIDRNLLPESVRIVIHGSGFYTSNDYEKIPLSQLEVISDNNALEGLRRIIVS